MPGAANRRNSRRARAVRARTRRRSHSHRGRSHRRGVASPRLRAFARRRRPRQRRPLPDRREQRLRRPAARASPTRASNSLQVIDLAAQPSPVVVQSVYFPSPQSVNVGVAFGKNADRDGAWPLYASGGVQDRVWLFTLHARRPQPLAPANDAAGKDVERPVHRPSPVAPGPAYESIAEQPGLLYPAGLAVGTSGRHLFVVANLADSLAVVQLADAAAVAAIAAPPSREGTRVRLSVRRGHHRTVGQGQSLRHRCWNEATVAVVDPRSALGSSRRIPTGSTPRLPCSPRRTDVACSSRARTADTVSIIDTMAEREIERSRRSACGGRSTLGNSTQALALSTIEHERSSWPTRRARSVAVVALGARGAPSRGNAIATMTPRRAGGGGRRRVSSASSRPRATRPRWPSSDGSPVHRQRQGRAGGAAERAERGVPAQRQAARRLQRLVDAQQHPARCTLPDGAVARGDDDAACMRGERADRRAASSRLFLGPSPITPRDLRHQGEPHLRSGARDVPRSGRRHAGRRRRIARALRQRRRGAPAPRRAAAIHRAQPPRARAALRPLRSLLRQLRGERRRPQLVHGRLLERLRGQGVPLELLGPRPHLRLRGLQPAARLRAGRRSCRRSLHAAAHRGATSRAFMRALRAVSQRIARRRGARLALPLGCRRARRASATAATASSSAPCRPTTCTALNARRPKTYPDISPTVATVPTKARSRRITARPSVRSTCATPDAMTADSYRAATRGAGVDAADPPGPRRRAIPRHVAPRRLARRVRRLTSPISTRARRSCCPRSRSCASRTITPSASATGTRRRSS